jgi:ABC-type nickel/cobalt efflux system permease component RcnA
MLLALVVLLAIVAGWLLWRRHRRSAYRRQGLHQLAVLRHQLQQDQDAQAFAASVNALLKSVALHAYPRREVAASSGGPWLAFLRETGGATLPEELAAGPYRASTGINTEELYRGAADWIRSHRPLPKEPQQ